jgi:hypothetical protein
MVDTSAEADIRGINIDTLAKGFADELNIFKKFINVTSTKSRELRWYAKTTGFLDTSDSGAVTASGIANTSFKARPFVVEQSWTRNTSYIRKYFVESPWISDEDIKDNDVDILGTNIKDLVRAVERQVDARIYNQLTTATGVQTSVSVADGWDDTVTGDPIADILTAKAGIRSYGYNPEGSTLAITSLEHRQLLQWLVNVKGSSIPSFASKSLESGVVMEILGCNVVVSENATANQCLIFTRDAATWKSFMPITAVKIEEKLIGTKIRVAEEGEIIVHDPKACYLLTAV